MKKHRFQGVWCRKIGFLLVLTALMMSLLVMPASAAMQSEAYDTYTYWTAPGSQVTSSASPMYEYKNTITGADLGLSAFSTPSDVFVDSKGLTYLSDKGNGRVVVMNPDYTLKTVIQNPVYKGEALDITGFSSVFVTVDNKIYVADTENARVLIMNIKGQVSEILYLPDDDVIPSNFEYKPEKIAVDTKGYTYILSNGSYYGAVTYNTDGQFAGFYGANSVKSSVLDVFTRIWETFFVSDEQKANSQKSLPYCFTDIAIDQMDFTYTATAPSSTLVSNVGQLKKLSPGGTNILKNKTTTQVSSAEEFDFGDGQSIAFANMLGYYQARVSYLSSMDVDADGYMYGLCQSYGHIFVYDQSCNQLTVFGGGFSVGTQKGTFTKAVNIQVNDITNDVLVVDEALGSITIFKETEYGALVKKAQILTNDGDYVEAKEFWQKALSFDRNSQLAYRGLARAAIMEEDYETALYYAELGYDQDTYATAFSFVRNDYLAENFFWIFTLVIIVIAGIIALFVYLKKKDKKLITNPKLATMFQSIMHPFEGAKQVKYYGQGSLKLATGLLVLYFVTAICSEIYAGFMYSMMDKSDYSSVFTIIRTVGIVVLWSVVNWAMTTLFQGKGTMKEVYIVTCYALIPQIINNILLAFLSNVLTPEEALVITAISVVCTALTAIMLCVGIMTVHEFGFFKFITMSIITIFGMLICVFVIAMVIILVQQFTSFIGTLINEISYS